MRRNPATREAKGLLLSALSLASSGELERAAQKAEDAAMVLRAVLKGNPDADAEVRRVMEDR